MISLTKAAYVTELARDQAPYFLPAGQAESYLAGKKNPPRFNDNNLFGTMKQRVVLPCSSQETMDFQAELLLEPKCVLMKV